MAIHFTNEEFKKRQKNVISELNKKNLDGILIFRQESMYYLSGYDSFGYAHVSMPIPWSRRKNGFAHKGSRPCTS